MQMIAHFNTFFMQMIAHFNTFFMQMIAHFYDNVLDSAELINSEQKCLEQWLKLNKISINADKTKLMMSWHPNLSNVLNYHPILAMF